MKVTPYRTTPKGVVHIVEYACSAGRLGINLPSDIRHHPSHKAPISLPVTSLDTDPKLRWCISCLSNRQEDQLPPWGWGKLMSPGGVLAAWMKEQQLEIEDFVGSFLPASTIAAILKDVWDIDEYTAARLEALTGTSYLAWLGLYQAYRAARSSGLKVTSDPIIDKLHRED